MRIRMLTRYSPAKGKRLEAGAVVDIEDEVALDLVRRGLAEPIRAQVERAVEIPQRMGNSE